MTRPAQIPQHLMVVDDDADIRSFITAALVRLHIRITTAQNVSEAAEAIQLYPDIDFVMVDASIAGGKFDSRGFIETLVYSGFTGRIIGMSGQSLESEMVAAGCQMFLTKPTGLVDFLHQLAELQ